MKMDGSFYYPAYGLQLCSSRSIPSLIPIEKNPFPCVDVCFEGLPRWFGGSFLKECRTTLVQFPDLTVTVIRTPTDTYWHLWFTDHTEYLIKNDGLEIWVSWRESVAFADVCASLLGPVFGLVLQLRGRTPLHASTVVIDGLAVAFLGPSEAGKSTTAAKFAQLGYAVLAEDVLSFLPDDDEFMATPGYPEIRLWPQSVKMLHSRADSSSYHPAGQDKLVLDLQPGAYRFEAEPKPLAAIYVLKTRKDDETAPYLEPLEPHRALLELVANTLGQFDVECRARNFSFLARLARAVPLRKMVPHCNPDRLEKMCALIAGDFRKQVVPWWKMRTGTHV